MKIVVTGATGFVGQWLVNELLDQNDDVTILVRNKERIPKKWKGCVHMVEAAMEQASGLDKKEFPCGEADIFIHLAWAGA